MNKSIDISPLITPADIQKKALRQYKDFLSAVLKREHLFPLYITGNKGKASMPLDQLYPALRRLLEGAKAKKGYGYTLTLKPVQTRHAGEISMPDEIFFENVEDYLKFIEKEKEFLAFRKVAMQTQKKLPELLPWMQENPMSVIKHLAVWPAILEVGNYFLKHPRPQVYIRALAIDIPATFIENNQAILAAVLEAILADTAIRLDEKEFERRFYLKGDVPLIRIRALGEGVFPHLPVQDLSLSAADWTVIAISATSVFITTDKLNFLRFPKHPNSLIIWANQATLKLISELSFLADKQLYFWGDIALRTFQQLSALRQIFPTIQAILLDVAAYKTFLPFAKTLVAEKITLIPNLNQEEQEFFLFLNELEKDNAIEQQHITQRYLQKVLNNL